VNGERSAVPSIQHPASGTPFLSLESLTKRFGDHVAVDHVSLQVRRGEIVALLGPSGSGKTTTLRLLAGFESPDAGRIQVDGEDVTTVSPAARRFGMVFQHYALFPHLDVGDNVGFGLESQGVRPPERAQRVAEALAMVELAGMERRPVSALSGGQQQRVALARALAPAPRVLLLDEPLSNLDPSLRERTRRELRALISRIGITTVLVTHEQEEAFDLAERVALLDGGRLQQVGTPEELYGSPATVFVAGFIGRSSAVTVQVESQDGDVVRVRLPGAPTPWEVRHTGEFSGQCRLLVRPEALTMTPPGDAVLSGAVLERRFLGAAALYLVELVPAVTLEAIAGPDAARVGDRVGLVPAGPGLHLFSGSAA